jgi:predicted Rossmann fold nucleotide-binding protein DprA/Smf involved in DNA uptake
MSLGVTIMESTSPHFPAALQNSELKLSYPLISAIGNLKILGTRLLGFFCATRCPGNVIVHAYDLARAMRDSGIPVIGGFHSPMEKECLDVLLRGTQPLVICPARGIERMRLPAIWRTSLAEGRLLILSPFPAHHRRPTTALAEQRNRFAATLADTIFVAHAGAGSRIERLCSDVIAQSKPVSTLDLPENAHLIRLGVNAQSVQALVQKPLDHSRYNA